MPESIADSQSVELAEYPYAPQPALFPVSGAERLEATSEGPNKRKSSGLAIALVVVFCWSNFSILPLMDAINGPQEWGAIVVFIFVGMVFTQAGLVSLAIV